MRRRVGTWLIACLAFALLSGWTSRSAAEPEARDVEKAGALYEVGRRAHQRGKHAAAARAFADADRLVPDAAALEAALVAVLKTDRAALGMELAERAARARDNAKLARLATNASTKFAKSAGRIVVSCDRCVALIDARPVRRGVATWVNVGAHEVMIRDGYAEEKRTVDVVAGAVMTLVPLAPTTARTVGSDAPSPEPPPEPSPEPDTAERGVTAAWFWIAFAATAAVGVGAGISAIDTASKHAQFSDEPTEDRALEGEAAQTRTNVLLGVTGGLAVVTLVVGLVVDWDPDDQDVAIGPGGWQLRF